MIDKLAFIIVQVLSLMNAIFLTFIAKYINDPDKNLEIETQAMSNWFIVYSNLEDLPPEVRDRILIIGKILLVFIVIIIIKKFIEIFG